jgi:hypothetical protein
MDHAELKRLHQHGGLLDFVTRKGEDLWEHRVKHCVLYKEYRRCYQQTVRGMLSKDAAGDGKCALLRNASAREYYMCPHWAHEGGDNEPCQPEADATYYQWQKHDDCTWSSDDDKGTLMGYNSARSGKCADRPRPPRHATLLKTHYPR